MEEHREEVAFHSTALSAAETSSAQLQRDLQSAEVRA